MFLYLLPAANRKSGQPKQDRATNPEHNADHVSPRGSTAEKVTVRQRERGRERETTEPGCSFYLKDLERRTTATDVYEVLM